MSAPSYSKAPAPASAPPRFGLRERLLLGLLLGALGTVLVAVVGWFSFQRVVDSQAALVSETLPAADALHDSVRANARLAAIAPRLARADSVTELSQLRMSLDRELQQIRDRLAALDSPHVEEALRQRLQHTAASLSGQLDAMADTMAERLALQSQSAEHVRHLREQIDRLEGVVRIQADNATAFLVASLTAGLHGQEEGSRTTPAHRHEHARDTVLDLDIDTLERMHELNLTVNELGALLDRLEELDTQGALVLARQHFETRLALLLRRVRDMPDPLSREQALGVHGLLNAALAPAGAFSMRDREIALLHNSNALQMRVGELTTELDALAGELIHRGGRILAAATLAADRSATPGFIAFGILAAALLLVTTTVIVQTLRRQTLSRLLALESATLALAAGQRDVMIDTHGDDELASLSRALERFRQDAIERDRLAEALRLERENLETEVARRTEQLREANAALAREMVEHDAARARAEKADSVKTAFLGTLSHELRTPISGMLGLLELLQPTLASPAQQHQLTQIRSAATLLLELLEDMLDFARIEAGRVHIDKTPFNLRQTVNEVFAVQGARAATRGLALVSDVDPAIPEYLVGDRPKLMQILLNLVGNAIKFSDEGVVQLRVVPLDASNSPTAPNALRFSVIDHGIGIDPERQADVFEPFVQVRDQGGRHNAGTGLGLAVCKRLVQALGGRIMLSSSPGVGTTVSFELTFDPAPIAVAGSGADSVADSADAPAAAPPPRQRVLVVEDDEVNRMVIERFLSLLGQVPLCADSVAAALHIAADAAVEAAIVDMNLPDGDGLSLLSRLRDMPRFGQTPAILISAHLPKHAIQPMLAAGFAAVLQKPFSQAQLGAALVQVQVQPLQGPGAINTGRAPAGAEDSGRVAAPWVDLAFLRAERDALGMATLTQIAAVFERQGEPLIASLQKAAAADDREACRKLAHKLRGAAANLGLSRLATQVATVEQGLARSGPKDEWRTCIEALVCDYTHTLDELKAVLHKLDSGAD